MNNKYKGSPLFHDIEEVKLRTWNRCAIVFNLMAQRGQEAAKGYIGALDVDSRKQVYGMFDCIKRFGYDAVRKQIKVEVTEQ